MSVQSISTVIEQSSHKGSALLLMIMIANHAHSDGTNSFPSIETLAKECRMSARQVIRLVATLEKSGELQVERSGGRNPHRYALSVGNPDKLSSPQPVKARARRRTKSPANPDKVASLNADNLAGINPDKMAGTEPPTLTSEATNPDIQGAATLTSGDSNPDKSGNPPIPPYKENHHEPLGEPSGEPTTLEASPPVVEQNPTVVAREAYRSGFLKRFGSEPNIVWDKDGKILKALIASYGLERVLQLIEDYLDSDDDFIVRGGYTIGILSVKLNSLIVQKGNGKGRLSTRSRANLAAYDEAMRIGPPPKR